MIKIGDFSQLSQVPVKTLRYYDEIDLLKPARIDPFTGYRYYALDQLPRLYRILALKDLGLSLEQIAQLLTDHLSPESIRGMFTLKRAELRQHIQQEQERLARVEARIRQIELEGNMSGIDVVIKHIETQRVLSFREVVPDGAGISRMFGEVFGAVMRAGVRIIAPPLTIYHSHDAGFDTEIAIPVENTVTSELPIDGTRKLTIQTLPAATVASTFHRGAYETIGDTYAALSRWVMEHSYDFVGPVREIYLTSPGETPNPADYLTEIQFPVEKVAVKA
jgi:DNA-binding transcriptional MerR regulator